MAGTTISALPLDSAPTASAIFPLVSGNVTRKAELSTILLRTNHIGDMPFSAISSISGGVIPINAVAPFTATNLQDFVASVAAVSGGGGTDLTSVENAITSTNVVLVALSAAHTSTNAALASTNTLLVSLSAAHTSTNTAAASTNVVLTSVNTALTSVNSALVLLSAAHTSTALAHASTNTALVALSTAFTSANAAHVSTNGLLVTLSTAFTSANAAHVSTNGLLVTLSTAFTSANAAHVSTNAALVALSAAHTSTNNALVLLSAAHTSLAVVVAAISGGGGSPIFTFATLTNARALTSADIGRRLFWVGNAVVTVSLDTNLGVGAQIILVQEASGPFVTSSGFIEVQGGGTMNRLLAGGTVSARTQGPGTALMLEVTSTNQFRVYGGVPAIPTEYQNAFNTRPPLVPVSVSDGWGPIGVNGVVNGGGVWRGRVAHAHPIFLPAGRLNGGIYGIQSAFTSISARFTMGLMEYDWSARRPGALLGTLGTQVFAVSANIGTQSVSTGSTKVTVPNAGWYVVGIVVDDNQGGVGLGTLYGLGNRTADFATLLPLTTAQVVDIDFAAGPGGWASTSVTVIDSTFPAALTWSVVATVPIMGVFY